MENEATTKGEAASPVKVDEYVDEYILDLLKAGRVAVRDLFTPRHRGAIWLGEDKYLVWSWETPHMPHLAALEQTLHDELVGHFAEGYGGISDGLGVWIVTFVKEDEHKYEKQLNMVVRNSFKRSFDSSLG